MDSVETYLNRYVHFKHCQALMRALRWHGCWAIHPTEGSAEVKVHFQVLTSVSDESKHGDGEGDHDSARSQKET